MAHLQKKEGFLIMYGTSIISSIVLITTHAGIENFS